MRRREFFLSAAAAGLRGAAPGSTTSRLAAIQVMVDMPDFAADPGKKFDPRRFIRLCRDARVDVIEFKCKNAVARMPWATPCSPSETVSARAIG